MRRLVPVLALVCALGLVSQASSGLPFALQFTNGTNMSVAAAPSASLNNLPAITITMWVKLTTAAPAAQRNFVGKGAGNNRVAAFINSTSVSFQRGSSGTAPTGTALTSNLPALVANQPVFLAFVGDFGVTAPRLYAGSTLLPVSEASAYSTSATGSTAGHDDSADNLNVANSGVTSTTNTLPGVVYTVQVIPRAVGLDELRALQGVWMPRYRGAALAWVMGVNGTGRVLDQSGANNHGTITGAIPVRETLPLLGWRRAA